jgi:hypothetical protein
MLLERMKVYMQNILLMRGVRHTGSRGEGQIIRTYGRRGLSVSSPQLPKCSEARSPIIICGPPAIWCHLKMSVVAVTKKWGCG